MVAASVISRYSMRLPMRFSKSRTHQSGPALIRGPAIETITTLA
jgi:hypothetical protein